MPTLYYRVEAPGVNILKTVSDEVVFGLLDELDLSQSFKNSVYIMSSFMASSQYDDGNRTPTLVKNRCDVDINYVMDKSQVPWPVDTPYTTAAYGLRASSKGNHTPILIDEKAGILIEHHTVACALDMNFVLTFTTFDEACKAFDTLQNRYKGSLIQTPFDISFSYPVSVSMLKFLIAVQQAKLDYKTKTILDYINDMKRMQISFDVRKSQLIEPDADKELLIRCQQIRCLAQLTMDQKEPDANFVDNLPDAYTISFNMTLQFGRPNLVAIHTPISVDNMVLPYGLFENIVTNFHYNPDVSGIYQDLLCNEFMRRSFGDYNNAQRIIRLPVYDDWFSADKQYQFYQYRPLLIAHFTLDDSATTINIRQLDDVVLHPVVQQILIQMKNKVFEYGGLFHLGVYADNLRLGPELVTLDENLNLVIRSDRKDKVYHLVLSETTNLNKMTVEWDDLLVKYRYFFPLTIERNLQTLIKKKYFYVAYDNTILAKIALLEREGRLKDLLKTMVLLEECTNEIYSYTQNPSQLADYMVYTPSSRKAYVLPIGTDQISTAVRQYYSTKASVEGRSLLVAFIEQCLISGYMTLDEIPAQYLEPNTAVYPYYNGQGGYYGFNTPVRIFNYTINPQRNPQ